MQIKLAIKYLVMANYPKILHFCNPEQYCLSKTIQLIDIVCENQYTCTVKQSIRDEVMIHCLQTRTKYKILILCQNALAQIRGLKVVEVFVYN